MMSVFNQYYMQNDALQKCVADIVLLNGQQFYARFDKIAEMDMVRVSIGTETVAMRSRYVLTVKLDGFTLVSGQNVGNYSNTLMDVVPFYKGGQILEVEIKAVSGSVVAGVSVDVYEHAKSLHNTGTMDWPIDGRLFHPF